VILNFPAMAESPFAFHDGDRVVFLGDSITQGWNPAKPHSFTLPEPYPLYLESALLEQFPDRKLTFRNAGWGSDRAWLHQRVAGTDMSGEKMLALAGDEQENMLVRMVTHGLNRDVFPLKPTVVFVMYGVNDMRDSEHALRLHTLAMQEILRQLRSNDCRVVLLATTPEEPLDGEWNKKHEPFVAAARDLAAKENVTFLDLYHACLEKIGEARKTNPSFGFTRDGIHPQPPGNVMMARAILAGLGLNDTKLNPESPLLAKVIEKDRAYFRRWREIQIPAMLAGKLDTAETRSQLADADKRVADLETEIDNLRPKNLQ
jgi:lysophospholipase L1-like esterase